ncbi:hypothetical protein, partial [Staphylococcus aureus]
LYNDKKWLREPVAHAIVTLLNSYYTCGDSEKAAVVVSTLVETVVLPEILFRHDEMVDGELPLYETLTAEQLAVIPNIQAHSSINKMPVP